MKLNQYFPTDLDAFSDDTETVQVNLLVLVVLEIKPENEIFTYKKKSTIR